MSRFPIHGAGEGGGRKLDDHGSLGKHLKMVLDAIDEAVICTDTGGHLTYLNKAAMKLTGGYSGHVLGQPWNELFTLIDDHGGVPVEDPFRSCIISGIAFTNGTGCILRTRAGREVFVEANTMPIYDDLDENRAVGAVMTLRDLTDISELLASVFRQAPLDVVTSLLDRQTFLRRLSSTLLNIQGGREHILMQIEVTPRGGDGSQQWLGIEETILRQTVALLASRIRDRDALGARDYGQFWLLLEHCDCDEGLIVARQLRDLIREHDFCVLGQVYRVDVHIGVVSLNKPYVKFDGILRTLEQACEMARTSEKGAILVVPNGFE